MYSYGDGACAPTDPSMRVKVKLLTAGRATLDLPRTLLEGSAIHPRCG